MAIFSNLQATETVGETDELFIHQNNIDKKINFELASALNWAKLLGYTYEGEHTVGKVYNTLNSFATSSGVSYFPKYNTTVPYTSSASNPATDTNLTKQSYKDYKASVDAVHTVGATLQRFDATSPNTLYPWQTWVLVSGDGSIRLGDGTVQSQQVTGNNTPSVPLKNHTHTMNHNHASFKSSSDGAHNHVSGAGLENRNGTFKYGFADFLGEDYLGSSGEDNDNDIMPYTSTSSPHNHDVDVPNYAGSTGTSGDGTTPTLDVRGAYIKMNLWLRTA